MGIFDRIKDALVEPKAPEPEEYRKPIGQATIVPDEPFDEFAPESPEPEPTDLTDEPDAETR